MRLAGEILGHLKTIQATVVAITSDDSTDTSWVSDPSVLDAFAKIEAALAELEPLVRGTHEDLFGLIKANSFLALGRDSLREHGNLTVLAHPRNKDETLPNLAHLINDTAGLLQTLQLGRSAVPAPVSVSAVPGVDPDAGPAGAGSGVTSVASAPVSAGLVVDSLAESPQKFSCRLGLGDDFGGLSNNPDWMSVCHVTDCFLGGAQDQSLKDQLRYVLGGVQSLQQVADSIKKDPEKRREIEVLISTTLQKFSSLIGQQDGQEGAMSKLCGCGLELESAYETVIARPSSKPTATTVTAFAPVSGGGSGGYIDRPPYPITTGGATASAVSGVTPPDTTRIALLAACQNYLKHHAVSFLNKTKVLVSELAKNLKDNPRFSNDQIRKLLSDIEAVPGKGEGRKAYLRDAAQAWREAHLETSDSPHK